MNLTREQVEEAGTHTSVKVAVEVLVDKKTGNILYPCEACGKLMDRFINLTDPTSDADKPVNVLCNKCRRKHQRKPIPSVLVSFLFDLVWVKVEDKWQEAKFDGEETAVDFFRKKLGWEF